MGLEYPPLYYHLSLIKVDQGETLVGVVKRGVTRFNRGNHDACKALLLRGRQEYGSAPDTVHLRVLGVREDHRGF